MADIGDQAQEREQENREAALAAFRARHPAPAIDSAYFCRCCGERIPEERRHAVPGTQHCTWGASQIDRGR